MAYTFQADDLKRDRSVQVHDGTERQALTAEHPANPFSKEAEHAPGNAESRTTPAQDGDCTFGA
jgi:hypothetical protein